MTPQRRGRHQLPPLQATLRLPASWAPVAAGPATPRDGELRVLPDLRPLGRYDALVRQNRLREMGLQRSRQRGEGTELSGLRAYVAGDAFNRIDWKATARRAPGRWCASTRPSGNSSRSCS